MVDTIDQCITCCIYLDSLQFHLSVVYGLNDGVERKRLWDHLHNLHITLAMKPWILASDFNMVAHPFESSNYNGSHICNYDITEFRECLLELSL